MKLGWLAVVAGTRPEIIKLGQVARALGPACRVVHTGQHESPELATDVSFDRAMPEEINRCVISVLTDVHCAPTATAVRHLLNEGVPAAKIELTGNTIVETTLAMVPPAAEAAELAAQAGVEPYRYVLATIHRTENADHPARLEAILDQLAKLGLPVLLSLHSRTRQSVTRYGLIPALDRLRATPPVDYRTFLGLASLASLIVSDSGGLQEECTVLKRPLIVVRNSTERPESIAAGFAWLVQPGEAISDLGRQLIADAELRPRLSAIPCPFGDGTASERIAVIARGFL